MTIQDIFSGSAVLISIIALFISWITHKSDNVIQDRNIELQKENNELQQKIVELEERKEIRDNIAQKSAILRTTYEVKQHYFTSMNGTPKRYFGSSLLLNVKNIGVSSARQIVIELDGTHISNHLENPQGWKDDIVIGPEATIPFSINSKPHHVQIKWQDDSGIPGVFETDVFV